MKPFWRLLLAFILILPALAPTQVNLTAWAEDDDAAPPLVNGWVEVSNARQLIYIDRNQSLYLDRNIQLVNDIDLNGSPWVPLGGNEAPAFSGIFDGRGHRVSGVSIASGDFKKVGFFGEVSGSIKNLGVDVRIQGGDVTGALVGFLNGGSIDRSFSLGSVQGKTSSERPADEYSSTGGLAGEAINSTISRSYSLASVTGSISPNIYIGGLVGSQGNGEIRNSYARGSTVGPAIDRPPYLFSGGLLGLIVYGQVNNSYATGYVNRSGTSGYEIYGGLAANLFAQASASHSYYDSDTTGQSGDVEGITAKTTAEMKQPGTYSGWDFSHTWAISPLINDGYPYLRSEILTVNLPHAFKGSTYSAKLEAFDGSGLGLLWSATGLPDGLSINSEGMLLGSPEQAGIFTVDLSATDAGFNRVHALLQLKVDDAAPELSAFTVEPGSVYGSAKATAIPSSPEHAFAYSLNNSEPQRPLLGEALPGDTAAYLTGSDIENVSAGQYLSIYEVNSNGEIQAWGCRKLTANEINNTVPPTTGGVTGVVYGSESGGSPLTGATIAIGGNQTTADAQGAFMLSDIPEGTRTLHASARGYVSKDITVQIAAGETTDAGRIELKKERKTGGGGGGGSLPESDSDNTRSNPPASPPPIPTQTVQINGQNVSVPVKREASTDGRLVSRLVLDTAMTKAMFEKNDAAILEVNGTDTLVKIDLPLTVLQYILENRPGAELIIQVDGASYRLPLELWLNSPGGTLATVAIGKTMSDWSESIASTLGKQGVAMVTDAVQFMLYIDDQEWSDWGNLYLERSLTLDLGANLDTDPMHSPANYTVVWIDDHQQAHFVPSVFKTVNGVASAVFYAPHNSLYAVIRTERSFLDIQGHWARQDIELLANKLIVDGVTSNAFAPDQPVTRAEFATMLVNALGLMAHDGSSTFTDVLPQAWYAGSVEAARQAGLISGFNNEAFEPQGLINREQMAAMTARALHFTGNLGDTADLTVLSTFNDRQVVSDWAKEPFAQLLGTQVMRGVTDSLLAPQKLATRAECAAVIRNMLQYAGFINE